MVRCGSSPAVAAGPPAAPNASSAASATPSPTAPSHPPAFGSPLVELLSPAPARRGPESTPATGRLGLRSALPRAVDAGSGGAVGRAQPPRQSPATPPAVLLGLPRPALSSAVSACCVSA